MVEKLKDRLERRMSEVGVTSKRLAKEAGLNETYIRDILKERSQNPTASRIDKVFATLDRLGGKEAVPSITHQPESPSASVALGQSTEGIHADDKTARRVAVVQMWDSLERPEQDLTFDIIEAAVKGSLRRRYGAK